MSDFITVAQLAEIPLDRCVHIAAQGRGAQCREYAAGFLLRARHRLSKFLLRHGRRFTGTKKAWSKGHDTWLRAQTWPLAALEQTHTAYLRTVDEAVARLRTVEDDLRGLLTLEPLRNPRASGTCDV